MQPARVIPIEMGEDDPTDIARIEVALPHLRSDLALRVGFVRNRRKPPKCPRPRDMGSETGVNDHQSFGMLDHVGQDRKLDLFDPLEEGAKSLPAQEGLVRGQTAGLENVYRAGIRLGGVAAVLLTICCIDTPLGFRYGVT